jgi:hypothetical protein
MGTRRHNRVIRQTYQLIDQRGWSFSTLQVPFHCCDRQFTKNEHGTTPMRLACASEGPLRKPIYARVDSLSLRMHPSLERRRPCPFDEVMAAVDQQEPGVLEMLPRPSGSV